MLSGYNELGCAVVDTSRDQWTLLDGDRAWVWETVRLTGSSTHLDAPDLHHLNAFLNAGLMIIDEGRGIPETPGIPQKIPDEKPVILHLCTPWLARKSWSHAVRLSRLPTARTLRLISSLRAERSYGYPSLRSVEGLQERIIAARSRWGHRRAAPDRRSLAVATVLAADLVRARVDIGIGMQPDTGEPVWWCSTPEGPVGRPSRSLSVAIM